jgi:hypothetical protein
VAIPKPPPRTTRSRRSRAETKSSVPAKTRSVPRANRAAAAAKQKEVFTRRDGRLLRRITVFLPADLILPLKVYAAAHESTVSAAIADILMEHLRRGAKKRRA